MRTEPCKCAVRRLRGDLGRLALFAACGALVAPIAARLTELGVDAWFDREISAGQSFGAIIRARLDEAKAEIISGKITVPEYKSS